MECPQCKGYQLEPKEIEAGLLAGACLKCQGALIPLMNYRYWADQEIEVDTNIDDLVVEDISQPKQCPKCSRLMTKFQIGVESGNRIEVCNSCDEAWLDKGEWRLLKSLDIHNKLSSIFTDAWQRDIRLKQQESNLKERYEKQLGKEDFQKLDSFKQWLNKHPEKHQMKQYLMIAID